MKCKICSNKTHEIFIRKILGKYDVSYYKCSHCFFIQTDDPFWLEEAYSLGAISALDVGLMSRNFQLANKSEKIFTILFTEFKNFSAVDYGGGHGIFVRLMRDKGFNFFRQDLHADNIYARYFDIEDLPANHKFNILTAFEVFEHLPNPIEEIKNMFNYSNIILLSTELQPSRDIEQIKNWWYIGEESGQHISFFTPESFQVIATELEAHYYSNSVNLHILSKTKLPINPFNDMQGSSIKKSIIQKIVAKLNGKLNGVDNITLNNPPESLIMTDFEFVKKNIRNNRPI